MNRGPRGLLVLGVWLILACGNEQAPEVIDRETFISTWIDLRAAAWHSGGAITDEERERVLARHEVTEDELLAFAEAHGEDPSYMVALWTEVEQRMRQEAESDSTRDVSPGA